MELLSIVLLLTVDGLTFLWMMMMMMMIMIILIRMFPIFLGSLKKGENVP